MPTANIGLTKPSSGSTGWGSVVNTNFDLIDAAFEGLSDSAIVLDDSGGVVTIATGATNGTQFGGAVTQMIAFYGGTPIVQPAHADQAAMGAPTQEALSDGSGGTASTTIDTISDGNTADAVASIVVQLENAKNDILSLRTLTNQLRADLVTLALIKGSA